jgi:hypothetical protein
MRPWWLEFPAVQTLIFICLDSLLVMHIFINRWLWGRNLAWGENLATLIWCSACLFRYLLSCCTLWQEYNSQSPNTCSHLTLFMIAWKKNSPYSLKLFGASFWVHIQCQLGWDLVWFCEMSQTYYIDIVKQCVSWKTQAHNPDTVCKGPSASLTRAALLDYAQHKCSLKFPIGRLPKRHPKVNETCPMVNICPKRSPG